MTFVSFEVDTSDLTEKLERLSRIDKNEILDGMGFIIENHVVQKIDEMGLVDNGHFKNSVHHYVEGDVVYITDKVHYGVHLEYGTRDHMVKPRSKKALHWEQEGEQAFSKGHMVSGIREYAPFRKGLINSQEEVVKYVRNEIIRKAR